jgi:hypothetical protein
MAALTDDRGVCHELKFRIRNFQCFEATRDATSIKRFRRPTAAHGSPNKRPSAARRTKALKTHHPRWPTKLNLDGNAASHRALRVLRQENPDWQFVEIRSRRYLNNIVEQDHRAIKRRCAPMLAMKSFRTAAITLVGVELAHRIRKSQFTFGSRGPHQFSSLKHAWARALVPNDNAHAWLRIPRDGEQCFHGIVNTDSTAT